MSHDRIVAGNLDRIRGRPLARVQFHAQHAPGRLRTGKYPHDVEWGFAPREADSKGPAKGHIIPFGIWKLGNFSPQRLEGEAKSVRANQADLCRTVHPFGGELVVHLHPPEQAWARLVHIAQAFDAIVGPNLAQVLEPSRTRRWAFKNNLYNLYIPSFLEPDFACRAVWKPEGTHIKAFLSMRLGRCHNHFSF
jgi:hypothetical protein